MKTLITVTDESTGKSTARETSQPINEAIQTIADLSKGRICGTAVRALIEGRRVTFSFSKIATAA